MFRIFKQPYPYPEQSIRKIVGRSAIEGLGIFLFLAIFQPFELNEWQHPHKMLVFSYYGIAVFVVLIFNRQFLPKIFPNHYQEKTWTVGKEIMDILVVLALITLVNLLISQTIFHDIFNNWKSVLYMFGMVLIIGILPIGFGVMSNYIYQLKKYNKNIEVHHQTADNQLVNLSEQPLLFVAENEKDSLTCLPNQLYFIESSDNYSTIFFEKNGVIEKGLLRSSLVRLEGQMNDPNIVRCHRSYIVNLTKVDRITGNAQGYKLHLDRENLLVPVARKYSFLIEVLKKMA